MTTLAFPKKYGCFEHFCLAVNLTFSFRTKTGDKGSEHRSRCQCKHLVPVQGRNVAESWVENQKCAPDTVIHTEFYSCYITKMWRFRSGNMEHEHSGCSLSHLAHLTDHVISSALRLWRYILIHISSQCKLIVSWLILGKHEIFELWLHRVYPVSPLSSSSSHPACAWVQLPASGAPRQRSALSVIIFAAPLRARPFLRS